MALKKVKPSKELMKIIRTSIKASLSLALALSLVFKPLPLNADSSFLEARALRIHDGDTIVIAPKEQVGPNSFIRLACIDAPELKQPLGPKSRLTLLAQISKGSTFAYKLTGRQDIHGRIVALVYHDNKSKSAQELLVGSGLAVVYEQYQQGCPTATLRALQAEAQAQKLGIWADAQACLPANFRRKQCP